MIFYKYLSTNKEEKMNAALSKRSSSLSILSFCLACLLRNEVTDVGVFSFFVVLSEREAEVVREYMEEKIT